jgi:hypothetical protein
MNFFFGQKFPKFSVGKNPWNFLYFFPQTPLSLTNKQKKKKKKRKKGKKKREKERKFFHHESTCRPSYGKGAKNG